MQSQIQTPLGADVNKTLRVKTKKKIFEMLLSSDLLGTLVAEKFYKSFKELHISTIVCEHHEGHQKPKGDCQGSKNFSSISFSQVLFFEYSFFLAENSPIPVISSESKTIAYRRNSRNKVSC